MPNFSRTLFEFTESHLDKVALIDDCTSLTYQNLKDHVFRFAAELQSTGLKPQDRVILYFDDCVEWPVAFLSCLLVGLNPVCVNHNNTKDKLDYLIDLTDADAIISSGPLQLNKNILQFYKNDILQYTKKGDVKVYEFNDDEPGFWYLTSGTSGHSKAIVHRHGNLLNYYQSTKDLYQIEKNSVVFATAKLSFGYGLHVSITVSLLKGATVYLMSGIPAPTRIFNAINLHNATHFYTVPTIINSILKHSKNEKLFPSLKHVFSAGESLPEVSSRNFFNKFNLRIKNSVGMSEATCMYLIQDFDDYEHGELGKPHPGVECKLLDENGNIVSDGEIGEMYVKTICMADGYWKDWKYSKHTFVGEWIRTGDMMKKTNSGNYVYVSRADDRIKINGQFVSSVEVENIILELKGINDCVVVFKEHTDSMPVVHAFVILDDHTLDTKSIQKFLYTKLEPFKIPKHIHVIDSIPKTLTNKKIRYELKQRHTN